MTKTRYSRLQVSLLTSVAFLSLCAGRGRASENPLEPPDTSGPRETISSFLGRMEDLYRVALSTESALERRARILPKMQYLVRCFDTREIAPSVADRAALQAAVYLKEIFDRIDMPGAEELPDRRAVKADPIKRFRIPGTEITLIRIADGPREGEYLFSGETIRQSSEYYDRIEHLPYKATASTRGLYRMYATLQGWLIPTAWVDSLPAWLHIRIHEQAIWQWCSLGIFALASTLILIWTYRIGRRRGASSDQLAVRSLLIRFVFPLTWAALSLFLDFFFTTQVRFTGGTLISLKLALELQLVLAVIVAVLVALNGLAEFVIEARQLRPGGIDGQLVRLGFRLLTFVLVAWLAVVGADYLGIPVTPLIAGIGVGGLAVALAAQHTLENLIAGLVLFADKPVRVGEHCRFGDKQGTVEQIGLRSTRIRALDRTMITIPNAEFAKQHLINFSKRDRIQLRTLLQLRYETTPDQLRYVLVRLRELLQSHPQIHDEGARVRFVAYGACSLDIELHAFALTSDWPTFLTIQEDVLLRIMDLVGEAGASFAFPAQVRYTPQDLPIDESRVHEAEAQVRGWRAKGLLASAGFAEDPKQSTVPPPHFPSGPMVSRYIATAQRDEAKRQGHLPS